MSSSVGLSSGFGYLFKAVEQGVASRIRTLGASFKGPKGSEVRKYRAYVVSGLGTRDKCLPVLCILPAVLH